jgi:hypothetical protein
MRSVSASTGGNGCSRKAQRPVSGRIKASTSYQRPTTRTDWSYSKGFGGSVFNALMLWRLFTTLRDLLLCAHDLLIGDRPGDVVDMHPQSLASGASAPGSSSSQPPREVQGGDHVTFDQLRHYHQLEVSGRITNVYEELADIRGDSSELRGRLTSHAQDIAVLTRQHADYVDETRRAGKDARDQTSQVWIYRRFLGSVRTD